MRKLFYLLLIIGFLACEKEEPINRESTINKLLVEEFTYNPYGVIFKITNDIDYINGLSQEIQMDSIAFMKFHINYYDLDLTYDDLNNKEYFTWIPYGHHVNWRYKYNDEKNVVIPIINDVGQFLGSSITIYSCSTSEINDEWFQELFPYPIDDTVYVSMNKLYLNK